MIKFARQKLVDPLDVVECCYRGVILYLFIRFFFLVKTVAGKPILLNGVCCVLVLCVSR